MENTAIFLSSYRASLEILAKEGFSANGRINPTTFRKEIYPREKFRDTVVVYFRLDGYGSFRPEVEIGTSGTNRGLSYSRDFARALSEANDSAALAEGIGAQLSVLFSALALTDFYGLFEGEKIEYPENPAFPGRNA